MVTFALTVSCPLHLEEHCRLCIYCSAVFTVAAEDAGLCIIGSLAGRLVGLAPVCLHWACLFLPVYSLHWVSRVLVHVVTFPVLDSVCSTSGLTADTSGLSL